MGRSDFQSIGAPRRVTYGWLSAVGQPVLSVVPGCPLPRMCPLPSRAGQGLNNDRLQPPIIVMTGELLALREIEFWHENACLCRRLQNHLPELFVHLVLPL